MVRLNVDQMSRYVSPVNPTTYPTLSISLLGEKQVPLDKRVLTFDLGIGLFLMAWFFVYEVTGTKYTRAWKKEVLLALIASFFLGYGGLFLLLWVGIYV
ncbi:unnamed protein product [Adineta ricciae]|uniref:Dolichyl-diphosphooligosaccharide-protein glycosyltransferase subunit TMEM258 n=1 Tax=Adineta ricciae TaxID=249248 RepID=A0A813Y816_ADIRI|nr:unnamed protein product [Adineta ricciae]